MPPLMHDVELDKKELLDLENRDAVISFFGQLGYNTNGTGPLTPESLGLADDLTRQIDRITDVATDHDLEELHVYLIELKNLPGRTVSMKIMQDIGKATRNRPGRYLMIFTRNFDSLHFVLFERVLDKNGTSFSLRPRPMTYYRRDADTTANAVLARRVLQRFSYTEADAMTQWEKLRSAFTIVEWSEVEFNNRALFSDYYLTHRLPEEPIWQDDPAPIARQMTVLLQAARKAAAPDETVTRQDFYAPVWRELGFQVAENKAASSDEHKPDYILHAGDATKPLAWALTYTYARNLDDADGQRDSLTSNEIPGAVVVSLLEAEDAPAWVIVTNGKLWRLYSSTISSKATNYYEVDLEESLAAPDQKKAVPYWWQMFRRQAFEGLLDRVMKGSAEYAVEIRDRLKERVFTEIFPQFAEGFIADMRAKGQPVDDLPAVFNATLTFLYRLMFVLYAESLELLPVFEESGYGDISLRQLKQKIADKGGIAPSTRKANLSSLSKTATDYYQRLSVLFKGIDAGDPELNLPAYNGGLFSEHSPEGRFLTTYAVPDYYLALGLDWLARDEDKRKSALAFIDFKSLGVRQLGSIYEGLLEFKLRVADQDLVVSKGKGKSEVYEPAAKAAGKAPVARKKGEIYLVNDKSERKATGSYYTPDYIVKYIVQHTVGPVLERKFEKLRQSLHDAEKEWKQHKNHTEKKNEIKGLKFGDKGYEDPAKFWLTDPMQQLADDCLDVKVLDPAMGSGHFLVEAVSFISDKLVDFLNGWGENPVWTMLERTREDIRADLERQGVTVDVARLTRVTLLKRLVLKRCIYGVDLNPMAVELAKVSLWLDAFTLGAPLSFLDHHLKCGNSLIGARVKEVQDYVAFKAGQEMLDMFSSSEFAGVMLATDLMRQVGYLPDNTVAQAKRSAEAYHDANDHLAPFKRMLDVYTSRWFGNGTTGKKNTPDTVRLFLRDERAKAWLKNPATPLDDAKMLFPATQMTRTALNAAAEKRFFHWELEFPEVFFAASTPGGQDVALRDDGGFDAVVGNPPYGYRTIIETSDSEYFDRTFDSTQGNYDLYQFFIEKSSEVLRFHGYFAFITPNTFLVQPNYERLRTLVFNRLLIVEINDTGGNVFEDAMVDTSICVFARPSENVLIDKNSFVIQKLPNRGVQPTFYSQQDFLQGQIISLAASGHGLRVIRAINELGFALEEMFYCTVGINTGYIKDILVSKTKIDDRYHKTISGSDIERYNASWSEEWICYDPALVRSYGEKGRSLPPEYIFTEPKILLQRTRNLSLPQRLIAYLDSDYNYYNLNRLSNIIKREKSSPISLFFLCALLNSNLFNWYFAQNFVDYEIKPVYLRKLPIRHIDFTTPADERERLVQRLIDLYTSGQPPQAVLAGVQQALDAGQTDVVHDLLAHLAQRMIDLNKDKQAEVKTFLAQVESALNIKPDNNGAAGIDSLKNKTALQGFLGDYQKGESHLSWDQYWFYLTEKNQSRFRTPLDEVKGTLQAAYEQALTALLPIKDRLKSTDLLIDQIVYRLYGLTQDEIALIERPQYEQALTDAKARVIADEKIEDDEEKLEKIAEAILPAAQRFFERIEPRDVEATLDSDLPNWRNLPPDAPVFLLTGDYNLRSLPDQMDFSSSVIPYTKAVEVALHKLIFDPFRDSHSDQDCRNEFLQKFMRGEKDLTLGSYMIILSSSRETALRVFMSRIVSDVERLATTLNDTAIRDVRNKAAHDEVLSREEAQQTRTWAIEILVGL